MKQQRIRTRWWMAAAALAVVGVGAPLVVNAADHLDAPGKFQSPRGRHDADINDVYAFPADSEHTVLALTTHPALGVVTTQTAYATDVLYRINIATAAEPENDAEGDGHDGDGHDGDGHEVSSFVLKFGAVRADGTQKYTVYRETDGHRRRIGRGTTGTPAKIHDGMAFAGARSDPFFFDLDAFNNTIRANGGRSFCAGGQGVDFFASLNTNAIVLMVENDDVGSKVGIWGSTTSLDGSIQYDRMGRPAINTVFNGFKAAFNSGVDEDKNEFNAIQNPFDDPTIDGGKFRQNVITVLQEFSSLSGTAYTDAEAGGLADVLLPDVLPYNTADPVTNGVFNGRALADDVIDTELGVVTKGAVPTDCVGPHADYSATFPYLGAPHQA